MRLILTACVTATAVAGCGSRGGVVGPAYPIYPGVTGEQVGYASTGPGGPTPYPVVCADRAADPPPAMVQATLGSDSVVHLTTGEDLLVRFIEKCTFNLQFVLPLRGDTSTLQVLDNVSLPSGVQGPVWLRLHAVHPGQAVVTASGGCAIPYPTPREPAGVRLVCDSVGHVAQLTVVVS